MSCAIVGLGTALPKFSLSQDQAAAVAQVLCLSADQAPLVPVLYRQTEINRRHMVLNKGIVNDLLDGTRTTESVFLPSGQVDDHGPTTQQRMGRYVEEAGPLAIRAAQAALTESGLEPGSLTHLITISCTGFSAPGVDFELIKALELSPTIQRTHIGFMGCHGALNGLRVARAFTDADANARVLLCAVELCSLHYHYGWDPKRVVANALFGDGAAAVVGVPSSRTNSEAWQLAGTGSCLFPDSAYAMTWNIGDYGFDMTLSTRVPNLIETNLRPWLEDWLRQQGVSFDQVGSWAIHPGGPRILNAVNQALGLERTSTAISREVLTEHGNMSSPTVLFILDRLRRQGALRPCVAMGFGPGLVVEASLFR